MQLKLPLALVSRNSITARFFPLWVYRLELQSLGASRMTDSGAQAMADRF